METYNILDLLLIFHQSTYMSISYAICIICIIPQIYLLIKYAKGHSWYDVIKFPLGLDSLIMNIISAGIIPVFNNIGIPLLLLNYLIFDFRNELNELHRINRNKLDMKIQ